MFKLSCRESNDQIPENFNVHNNNEIKSDVAQTINTNQASTIMEAKSNGCDNKDNRSISQYHVQHMNHSPHYDDDDLASSMMSDIRVIEFLFQGYKPEYWFWEMVVIPWRILLTAVLSIVSSNKTYQVGTI